MTEELFNSITKLHRKTFPRWNLISCLMHLKDEIDEVKNSLAKNLDDIPEEFADCFFLLFGAADRYGMNYQDICNAIQAKFEKNKARTWGKPDDNGVVKHTEEGYEETPINSMEALHKKLSEIPNEVIVKKARLHLSELCKTGGASFKMTVPVSVDDTDILFSEVFRRLKTKEE